MVFSRQGRMKNPLKKAPFLWFISLGEQRNEQGQEYLVAKINTQHPVERSNAHILSKTH
jgi:hypothetical protein